MVMKSHTPAGITGSKSGEIWFGGKDKEGKNRLALNFLCLVASFHISENVAKISKFLTHFPFVNCVHFCVSMYIRETVHHV